MGHRQEEAHHFLGPQTQAASLISSGHPIGLQGQTSEKVHCAAHGSC